MREAMAEDGAAMCEFYAWFEAAMAKQQAGQLAEGERITELTVDEKLSAERAKRAGFVGLASTPSPASTPMARCRTTAPRRSRTP